MTTDRCPVRVDPPRCETCRHCINPKWVSSDGLGECQSPLGSDGHFLTVSRAEDFCSNHEPREEATRDN